MLETYQHEISRKRRAARIFWLIVFFFAGFLYFFFQGYYPAIDFSFREVGYSGSIRDNPRDLIRSFGIVNVSVRPANAQILLSSGTYNNDEKRMTDYGEYSMNISHAGYIPSTLFFTIDRETPYYIDILSLLPTPRYNRAGTGLTHIARIDDDTWSAQTLSGMIILDSELTRQNIVSNQIHTHIGEGYYLSGSSIIAYNDAKEVWEERVWSGSRVFLESCAQNITIKRANIWCPEQSKILMERGQVFTGVIRVGKDFIELDRGLLVEENPYRIILFGSGGTGSDTFLRKDSIWYAGSGTVFLPMEKTKNGDNLTRFSLPLDSLEYSESLDTEIIFIGKIAGKKVLIFYELRTGEFSTPIDFPDTPLEEVRIEKRDGNIFFKTKYALLFLYHNNQKVEWLIDGEILAFAKEHALYRKDGFLWKATWTVIE